MVKTLKISIELFSGFRKTTQNRKLCSIYYESDVEKKSRSRDQENTNQQNFLGFKT